MTERAEFERKLAGARAELAAAGISTHYSWLDRALQRLGLRLRPSHYRDPVRHGVAMGVYFAVFWGTTMWLLVWSADGTPILLAMGAAVFAGVLFGVFMALSLAFGRRRHRLTPWEEL